MANLTAEQAQHLHREAMARRAEQMRQADENRRRHPELAKFVDEVRSLFPGAKVTYLGDVRPHTREVMGLRDER